MVEALRELGIDVSDQVPGKPGAEEFAWADLALFTDSEKVCPVAPGVRRPIRDEIDRLVGELVAGLDRERDAQA